MLLLQINTFFSPLGRRARRHPSVDLRRFRRLRRPPLPHAARDAQPETARVGGGGREERAQEEDEGVS